MGFAVPECDVCGGDPAMCECGSRADTIAIPRTDTVVIDEHSRPTRDMQVTTWPDGGSTLWAPKPEETVTIAAPTGPRTITGDLRERLETAERLAYAAGCAQRVAEERCAKAEAEVVELRGHVADLWAKLGALLTLFRGKEFRFPEEQTTIQRARDLHACYVVVDEAAEGGKG